MSDPCERSPSLVADDLFRHEGARIIAALTARNCRNVTALNIACSDASGPAKMWIDDHPVTGENLYQATITQTADGSTAIYKMRADDLPLPRPVKLIKIDAEGHDAAVIAGMWPDAADNEKNTRWVKDYYAAIHPHAMEGGYINFMADDDQGRIRDNYKGNYDRLVSIKRQYDPENLFHMNQNIVPGATRSATA